MKRNLNILTSPASLLGLALLLLNDSILKRSFHNGLTGKLSDFAGLFIFPLFRAALFPRLRGAFCVLTAPLFIVWKTGLSRPLIGALSSGAHLRLPRTVDSTDLSALLALPASYVCGQRRPAILLPRFTPYVIAAVAVFAFTATRPVSYGIEYNQTYFFDVPRQESFDRINRQNLAGFEIGHPPACCPNDPAVDTFNVRLKNFCGEYGVDVEVKVSEEGKGESSITLLHINYDCPKGADDRQRLLEDFEAEILPRLKATGP